MHKKAAQPETAPEAKGTPSSPAPIMSEPPEDRQSFFDAALSEPTSPDEDNRSGYFMQYLYGRPVWPIERACLFLHDLRTFRNCVTYNTMTTGGKLTEKDGSYVRAFMDAVREHELTNGRRGIKGVDTKDGKGILAADFVKFAALREMDKEMPDYVRRYFEIKPPKDSSARTARAREAKSTKGAQRRASLVAEWETFHAENPRLSRTECARNVSGKKYPKALITALKKAGVWG